MRIASHLDMVSVAASDIGYPNLLVIFNPENVPPLDKRTFAAGTKFIYGDKGIVDLGTYPYAEQKLLSLGLPNYWQAEDRDTEALDSMPAQIKEEYLEQKEAEEKAAYEAAAAAVGATPAPRRPRN